MHQRGIKNLSAITHSFIENSRFLKRYLARFFSERQDIEDVLQETYLRAYSKVGENAVDHPKALLYRIAKNIALNELTKKSNLITQYIEDCYPALDLSHENSAEMEAEARQTLGNYCEALAELPEKCRKVYLLRKVHGLTHDEIAKCMGLSLSSVEKYIARGMLHCKTELQKRESPRSEAKILAPIKSGI